MIFKDYYKILGLDTNRVSMAQIKNAYREQAKKYHPDVNVGNKNSEERFKDINEAYRILSENTSKRKYDRIWLRNATNKRTSYSHTSKGDFFTMFFGTIPDESSTNIEKKVPVKGDNLETEIKLKIEEAFRGVTKSVSLRTTQGTLRTLKIDVPPGIRPKEKIRIVGQGKPGKNGGKNGELYIRVKFQENEEFVLDGVDLRKTLKITPWEAALGAKIKINGIDEDISVYIPAGTCSGETISIEGKGFRDGKSGRGNLILDVQILIPKDCTEQEKELYGELKKISKFNPRKS